MLTKSILWPVYLYMIQYRCGKTELYAIITDTYNVAPYRVAAKHKHPAPIVNVNEVTRVLIDACCAQLNRI